MIPTSLQLTRLSIICIHNAVYPDADFAGLHETSDPRVRGLLRLCEACQHGDERDGENQLCHRRLHGFRSAPQANAGGNEGLALHHFYRAMAWVGQELEEKPLV